MKVIAVTVALLATCMATSAQAQSRGYRASLAVSQQRTYFPIGTPIEMTLRTPLSTKYSKPGDRAYLELTHGLVYRGQAVIPAGATVVGEVVRADRNGHIGRKGHLELRPLYVETYFGPVRVNGSASDAGTSGVAASLLTMGFVSPIGGFLIHGTSAHLAPGTAVTAYLAEEVPFKADSVRVETAAIIPAADGLPARFDPAAFSRSAR